MSAQEGGQPPRFQLPGLQIFSSINFNRSDETMFQNESSPSESWTSTSVKNHTNNFYNQVKKLSDWGIEDFNDNSPTVVDVEQFNEEVFEEDVRASLINTEENHSSAFEELTFQIFRNLPFASDQFTEEFQYTVITSQLLDDSMYTRSGTYSMKKSILDFHKGSTFSQGLHSSIPTKYGKLIISGKKFYLQKSMPFLPTMLFIYKCLRKLLSASEKRKRIFTLLMICCYLCLQQEYFYSKYIKYSALLTLKSTLKLLQKLDVLLHRFHMRYKELTIYRPIALTQSNHLDSEALPVVRDILTSALDLLFYRLKHSTTELLTVINVHDLSYYCEIYNVSLVDLHHSMNNEAREVQDKVERVHSIKKFILCCLLSINHKTSTATDMTNSLHKIFPGYEPCNWTNENDKFVTIRNNLQYINSSSTILLSTLNSQREHLCSLGPMPECEKNKYQTNHQITTTLGKLGAIQKELLSNREITQPLESRIIHDLKDVLKMWQYHSPIMKQQPLANKKARANKIISGLTLDVVKSPLDYQDSNNAKPVYDTSLDSPVEFVDVEDTGSDLDTDNMGIDFEERVYINPREDGEFETVGDKGLGEKFRKLTDEELRNKLDERIMRFAMENKRGKEMLRTQKSFELLSSSLRKQHATQQHDHKEAQESGSRPFYNRTFTSEESIPVLYELKKLLEKK